MTKSPKKPDRPRVSACRRWKSGKASKYIAHAPSAFKSGDKVVLCCRVSRNAQKSNGNLADQEANLRSQAHKYGAVVVDTVRYVGSGTDPFWLAQAVDRAKCCDAKLFAESTDRLIRHPAYHSNADPNAQARDLDLQELRHWTGGVVVAIDLDPDALPEDARSYHRKRGQAAKGNVGGRPNTAFRPKIEGVQRQLLDAISRIWKTFPKDRGERG